MTVDRDRDVTKRMNWFDRQFLRAQDLADEQDYHRDRRSRHNRLLHTPGVAEGLAVTGEPGDATVSVAPGTAIDHAGREMVLLQPLTVQLPGAPATAAEIYLVYTEPDTDPSTDPGLNGMATRTVEVGQPVTRVTAGVDPTVPVPTSSARVPTGVVPPVAGVLLAAVSLDGHGRLGAAPDGGTRRAAGVALGGEASFTAVTLQRQGRNAQAWPRLTAPRDQAIAADGELDVATTLQVGTAGDHPLRLSAGWTGFTDSSGGPAHAEISNDTGQFKALMIVGNRSADPAERRVAVWDALYVNGDHHVSGTASVSGALNAGGALSVDGPITAAGGKVRASPDGTVVVAGSLATNGLGTDLPSGIGTGIHTHSVFADGGTFAAGTGAQITASMDYAGNGFFTGDVTVLGALQGKVKSFHIDHPVDPGRRLVHSSLEGPEVGVYYRGEARLSGGRATVELPAYFEALTRPDGRTVQLTPVFDDPDQRVHALAASRVVEGRFDVRTVDGEPADQAFCWQVTAVRADVEPLAVEVDGAMSSLQAAATAEGSAPEPAPPAS